MIKSKKKNVIITIIKFFKAVLTSNDEILLRYVHTNGFIMDISELLFERKGIFNSGNLIFSSCLELFELIYKQNLKKFIKSICDNDNLKQKIREKPYLSKYFEKIFQRCEQYKEDDPFSQLKPNNNNTNNGDNIESELNEKKNLEELAYFESDEPNNINIVNNERNEIVIFNSEELKQKKENLILLQNKMTCKRKLEEPKEQGLIFKKVHDESKKIVNLNLSTKIDIVFQEKYN